MNYIKASTILFCLSSSISFASAAQQCSSVKFAEPGWTDLALTSAITANLLNKLGYKTEVNTLAMSVILEGMKNSDIDVMLGYWKPALDHLINPYFKNGSVENVSLNLDGAKYTYAVPAYVYDAGVKTFNDIAKYPDKFGKRIYGIAPGNNEAVIKAVNQGDYGLKGWRVIESSEQAMLSQVNRQIRRNQWIAFQAWEPHPMNVKFDIKYLSGGDAIFGPNFGGAKVYSTVRQGYLDQCPNIGKLITNMKFNLKLENEGMDLILSQGMSAHEAGEQIIKQYPSLVLQWLDGVKTSDGATLTSQDIKELF